MVLDKVVLPIKLGDKVSNKGIKDGMPVGYISEREWGKPLEDILSTECMRIYGFIGYEEDDIPMLKELQYSDDDSLFSNKRIKMDSIDKDILSSWRNPNSVKPIFGKSKFDIDIFKDSDSLFTDRIIDLNAIGAGSATIGTLGTYATWALAFADLVNLTGALTFTEISAIIETATAAITEDLSGNDFLCTSNLDTSGIVSNGHLLSVNHAGHSFNLGQEGAGDTLKFKNLNVKRTIAGAAATIGIFIFSSIASATVIDINSCILDINGVLGTGVRSNDSSSINMIYVNLILNAIVAGGNGILCSDINPLSLIENNSIYNCVNGIDANNENLIIRNNAILGNTNDYLNIGTATGENNADVDGTGADGNWNVGTNNQTGLTLTDQWESVTAADGSKYIKPKPGSEVASNGTTSTKSAQLIDGPWSSEIGAKRKNVADDGSGGETFGPAGWNLGILH